MSKNQSSRAFNLVRILRKFFVSAFVVCTFIAYAVREQWGKSDEAFSARVSTKTTAQQVPASLKLTPTVTPTALGAPTKLAGFTAIPTRTLPKPTLTPTPVPSGTYKDGFFSGTRVNTSFGGLQVEAAIQNGKIAEVQFLEYPSERRTSVRINEYAMPRLENEAIRVQRASVDIISGATLTSRAFTQSLQAALDSAKD